MRITSLTVSVLEPTFADGWYNPFVRREPYRIGAIRILTDRGIEGVSVCRSEAIPYICEYLAPTITGEDPRNIEELWRKMREVASRLCGRWEMLEHELGIMTAIGAIDIGLWDCLGKSYGLPCWRLLGGARESVPVYADMAPRPLTPEEIGAEAARCVEGGFSAVKHHISAPDPERILAEGRSIRAAIGYKPLFMIDFQQMLHLREAVATARRLEDYDLYWLEEPTEWDDQGVGSAIVAREARIPVAEGERLTSLHQCRDLLRSGGVSYLQPDILCGGGYTALRKMAALAEAYHISFVPHGAKFPELIAPLVAGVGNGALVPATPPGRAPETWSLMYENFKITDGSIHMTEEPGLGLQFRDDFESQSTLEVRTCKMS
jgi:L-alanine-DL-glutamate epimerase-like enolase superfamily enzyme